ncbi:hypothetical protein ACIQGZ_24365 [Streptomyces sp. NPDC092296]|uniref:WXG100-like domain-containing protein n=1 Tax=Streptomyces sp. NPDC092296 TaxID=3366012 RepID=UPI0038273EC1
MAVMLPSELDEILELIGIVWPNVDEDELRAIANEYRTFAAELDDIRTFSDNATGYLRSVTTGKAIDAFGRHWDDRQSKGMEHLGEVARTYAGLLDIAAGLIEAGKLSVIAQLWALFAEVMAAQAAAPLTFGLSEAGALAATQVTRVAVREILEQLAKSLAQTLLSIVEDAALAAVQKIILQLVEQGLENYTGVRDGYDVGEAVRAGISDGVNSFVGAATDPSTWANAAVDGVKNGISAGSGTGGNR